jgi:hypothetical protein
MPFTFPDHFVAGFFAQQRRDIRLAILVRQTWPQKGLGDAIDRRKAPRDHETARRRALARRGIGAKEVEAVALEPLERRQALLGPPLRPMHVMALLICHQHDDVGCLRQVDQRAGDGRGGEAAPHARYCRESGPHLQQTAPCRRTWRRACVAGLPIIRTGALVVASSNTVDSRTLDHGKSFRCGHCPLRGSRSQQARRCQTTSSVAVSEGPDRLTRLGCLTLPRLFAVLGRGVRLESERAGATTPSKEEA